MRLLLSFAVLCFIASPHATLAGEKSSRELYDALNTLRPDSNAVYLIKPSDRIELHRADLTLSFEEGRLGFFTAFDGRITGAVFSGRGHALAAPRDPVEKHQMSRFLGAPLLDQDFVTAYLRFTDDSAAELLHQVNGENLSSQTDVAFVSQWDSFTAQLNPSHSLRILFDTLSRKKNPYFYARLDGVATGPFDALLDFQHQEQFVLGQARKVGDRSFYDVWASYKIPEAAALPTGFRALRYALDTTILANNSLDASTVIHLRSETGGQRLLIFQLSRALTVETVSGDKNEPLAFFQNEGMTLAERTARGNDSLYVVLPEALPAGQEFNLHFRYHGNVIENAGNGVLFVSARESWYPHFGDSADFAPYDLTMRWPRRLRLVATGVKLDEQDDGDFRVGHWKTDKPASVAGFNLGEYASASLPSQSHSVDVYANRQLEEALNRQLSASSVVLPLPSSPFGIPEDLARIQLPASPPRPADALKELGKSIDSSIRFYESFSGPFPFHTLSVSQIPGAFAQGWPGLLYLPTYSYLSSEAQRRAGLSTAGQEHFTELAPFHEVAHQWWGNVVGWSSYRDQWIDEAISNYLAVLFADSQKKPDRTLRIWLDRFKQQLLVKAPGADEPAAQIGALTLGQRLNSSKSPGAYEAVIYSKGAWVIHMLREMLRQRGAKNPDARFALLLQTLCKKYAYRALSTADLQHEVEAVMTPAMDLEGGRSMEWFFEQWVSGTGIPHYRVEFTSHRTEKGYLIRGTLFQTAVPHSFISPVPLYASIDGREFSLGTVIAVGPETSFHFVAPAAPRKLLIDPHQTLLSVNN